MDATELKQRIGTHLRTLRRQRDMSQEELAERAQLHPTYISRIEAGRSLPALDVLMRLSQALNTRVEEFLYSEKERTEAATRAPGEHDVVTPAQIYSMLHTCTPAQLRLIKGLIEVVCSTPLSDGPVEDTD